MSSDNPVIEDFKKSIQRLKEVLKEKKTNIIRDSAIKRFELCFDLAWKSAKFCAKAKGVECYSPRDCLKAAFQLGLIEHNEGWLKVINDRNLTTHLYKEEKANEVYSHLSEYLKLFEELLSKLKKFQV